MDFLTETYFLQKSYIVKTFFSRNLEEWFGPKVEDKVNTRTLNVVISLNNLRSCVSENGSRQGDLSMTGGEGFKKNSYGSESFQLYYYKFRYGEGAA